MPETAGRGIVDLVLPEFILWKNPPAKEEAGTPNSLGIVGLAAAVKFLSEYDMNKVREQEEKLTDYTLKRLEDLDKLVLYGPKKGSDVDEIRLIDIGKFDILD